MENKNKFLEKSQAEFLEMQGKAPSELITQPEPKAKAEAPKAKARAKAPKAEQPAPEVEQEDSQYKKGLNPRDPRTLEKKRNKLLVSLRDSDNDKLKQIARSMEVSLNEAVAVAINEFEIKKR